MGRIGGSGREFYLGPPRRPAWWLVLVAVISFLIVSVVGTSSALASPVTSVPIAALLVRDPSHPMPITIGNLATYTQPFVNNWYRSVSYGTFKYFGPAVAASVTKSDGVSCDRQTMFDWANQNYPRSERIYAVVVPASSCPNADSGEVYYLGHDFIFWNSNQLVASKSPTANAVYATIHELGHTIFGGAHADALACQGVAYRKTCLSQSLSKTDPYSCLYVTPRPVVCQYGDPFDSMGNGFPGRRVPASQFPTPAYSDGDAWPNGVELDHVGWIASRKQDVNLSPGTSRTFQLSPIEEQSPAHKQFLFIAPTTNMTPWLEIEYRNPPTGTSRWTDGFLAGWPSVTGGILLHLATGLKGQSLSALLDTTPGSYPSKLCSPTRPDNAFCDFYDAALTPGRTFVAGGGDYSVKLISVGTVGDPSSVATISITRSVSPGGY